MQTARRQVHHRSEQPAGRPVRSLTVRAGFTLLEMLLVLAVLVAAAGISWPLLSQAYERQKLRQAAEVVQVRMMAARVHALETGMTYQFCFEPGGRRFVAIPCEGDPAATSSTTEGTELPKLGGLLPENVQFLAVPGLAAKGAATHLKDADLRGIPNADLFHGATWGTPVLFRPDGTATAGQVTLVDKLKSSRLLNIRELTGGVTISAGE